MECKGLSELEKLREKPGEGYYSTKRYDHRKFWPLTYALMVARAINKKITQRKGLTIDDLALPVTLPKDDTIGFPIVLKSVRQLVPSHISEEEIYQTFCRVSANANSVSCPPDTSAVATYLEYSLLNHMCTPNCAWEGERGDMSVYALQDIQPNAELGISYLPLRYRVNLRETRRNELKRAFGFDCSCFVCLEESKVGSKHWLLNQRKRSLIAPWSRKTADGVMDRGWKTLCDSESMEISGAIQVLKSSLEAQRLVLDKANIILILTGMILLYKCRHGRHYKEGMRLFKTVGNEGLDALWEYGTMNEIEYVGEEIYTCCYELGMLNEVSKISDMMRKLFPKVPSADKLCDNWLQDGYQFDESDTMVSTQLEKYQRDLDALVKSGEKVTPQKVFTYFANLCDRI